jgi:Cu-Zn family superoxide dismutase
VNGVITFQEVADFVRVSGVVRNLAPGKHGFHIHEGSSCDQRGGHFAPGQQSHGSPDAQERHVGDLGNLASDHAGEVDYLRIDRLIQLGGPQSIVGRVLVVHQGEDDYVSQPSGDSGEEIACGKIELTS